MKKYLSIVLVACIFFGLSGLALSDQGVTDDIIKIGIITDFTGATSAWGQKEKVVGGMWVKEINSRGGIHGRKVELLWEDHGYRPDRALTAAKKLINFDKVFCLMGGQCTPTNIVASNYAAKQKIPWVFPVNSLKKDAVKVNKYIFNYLPLHEPATRCLIDYAVETWNVKKFGILYQHDDYGKGELANAKDQLAKYNLKPVAVENFKRGALDASAQLARMKTAGCDVVNIIGPMNIAVSVLKEAQRKGWQPHFLSCISASNAQLPKLAGDAGNGMICPFWFSSPDTDTDGMNRLKALLKKYHPTEKLGVTHIIMFPLFDGMEKALEWTGRDLTVENFLTTLETRFKGYDNGITGAITYGPDDHVGADSVILAVIEDGKYKTITGFVTPKK
ncbi:MAG: hypothetical protein B1H11_09810 [Desulfobacteraceae bacterium 4484_190.1]|nr:MAG: hypothetical protein B1H11_09810 [Desulfobacteraceae bacterium 4484_190.1]